jgi:hypothetical protein
MKVSKKAYKKFIKKNFTFISFLDDEGNGVELDVKNQKVTIHENNDSENKYLLQYARSFRCYDFFNIAKHILKMSLRRRFRNEFTFYISCENGSWSLFDRIRKKDEELYKKIKEG